MTGNLEDPEGIQIPRFFTHNVRVDLLVGKLTQESRRRGGTLIFGHGDRSYWMPLTLFFWLNEFEVPGNVSRHPSETDSH